MAEKEQEAGGAPENPTPAPMPKKNPEAVVNEWFAKWLHNWPGVSDNPLIWARFVEARADLIKALQEGN